MGNLFILTSAVIATQPLFYCYKLSLFVRYLDWQVKKMRFIFFNEIMKVQSIALAALYLNNFLLPDLGREQSS